MTDDKDIVTEQTMRDIEAALPVARAIGLLEPALRKALNAQRTIRYAEAEVKRLEGIKATLAADIASERHAALEALEEMQRVEREKHKLAMDELARAAEGRATAAGRIADRVNEEVASLRARSQAEVAAAKTEVDRLTVIRRERSEVIAAEIAKLRAQKEQAEADARAATQTLGAEREALAKEIKELQVKRNTIREELTAILKR